VENLRGVVVSAAAVAHSHGNVLQDDDAPMMADGLAIHYLLANGAIAVFTSESV
jgi:hypothetical protein